MSQFEPQPRWPGAPPICTATNRPAFESERALAAYRDKNSPGYSGRAWKCEHCGQSHSKGHDSGHEDTGAKLGFVPFRRKRPSSSSESDQMALRGRSDAAKEKPVPLPKPAERSLL